MKIVENTPDRLVLEHFPWFMAGLTWTMGLAAFGAGLSGRGVEGFERLFVIALGLGVMTLAAVFMPFLRVTFDRAAGQVTRRRAHIDRARSLSLPLRDIARIRQEANWSDSARLTRLVLERTDGTLVALETGFSSQELGPLEAEAAAWLAVARDKTGG